MKKVLLLAATLAGIGLTTCSSANRKNDEVRTFRRQYKMETDFTVSNDSGEMNIELKVQNQAGTLKLQDLTIDIAALDGQQKTIWSKRTTLDVTDIAHHASKTFTFKETLEHPEALEYLNVTLAPDDKDSDYASYPEFVRVAAN
ncbi:MAG: hypothetical protein KDC35_15330 [Acidobacteria bacterium]|nr:hypothetical protein [Acidobacteriota bacterium]